MSPACFAAEGRRPRALFIGPLPDPVTGQSLACEVFFGALRERFDVDVVNLSKPSFRQGVGSTSRVREVLQIVRQVRAAQSSVDVIYFTISESLAGFAKDLVIYAVCFAKLPRMIVHLHGGAGMRVLMRGRWGLLRALNAFFLRRVGAIIVLGQRHLDVFAGAAPVTSIHVVPNFAQDELFSNPQAIEAKFSQLRPLRLLFLSNLLPGKGYTELLRAFAALPPATRESLWIDFAGGFESNDDRQAFLAGIAPFGNLRYHGVVRGEQKRALFTNAHVFCLPTYYASEGQPISILEAYASGCAVITTDHSGIFDTFADGVNGIAVEKRSVESLRSALARIAAAPSTLLPIALNNHRTALQQYTTKRYNDRLLGIVLNRSEAIPSSPVPAVHG